MLAVSGLGGCKRTFGGDCIWKRAAVDKKTTISATDPGSTPHFKRDQAVATTYLLGFLMASINQYNYRDIFRFDIKAVRSDRKVSHMSHQKSRLHQRRSCTRF